MEFETFVVIVAVVVVVLVIVAESIERRLKL